MFYLSRPGSRAAASKASPGRSGPLEPALDSELRDDPEHGRDSLDPAAPWSLRPPPLQSTAPGRDQGVRWSIHDRTHLQCSLVYRARNLLDRFKLFERFEWEVYFFVPDSFRLDSQTYRQDDIYADLKSYVRLAPREEPLRDLLQEPLTRLIQALRGDRTEALDGLRLISCLLRDALANAERHIVSELSGCVEAEARRQARGRDASGIVRKPGKGKALSLTRSLDLQIRGAIKTGPQVLTGLRSAIDTELSARADMDETTLTAADWVKAEISLMFEAFFGRVARKLKTSGGPKELVDALTRCALDAVEARQNCSLDLELSGPLRPERVEHFEFQRHVLKRFTSSVLWLQTRVREPGRWIRHALYAIAAGAAMSFAVAAALWNGVAPNEQMVPWLFAAVIAYAVKDRLKAILQETFSNVVARHFPDRRWDITDRAGKRIAIVDEHSGFVPFQSVQPDVLAARRRTRVHAIEEVARPETVLCHKKSFVLDNEHLAALGPDFDGLAEIFRLDLHRWLTHTDDPKQTVVVADRETESIRSYKAPRVYNIAVVYRLRYADQSTPWHRLRVVVSRKGLQRVDSID
ncbi:MAG: hypothetical protein H6718_09470 [Polyangiaceae bacterium]|nr:hypothetical protein [Myxococcales bacterium]MCB9585616.1 hypothetical protein [Polyangiaceae bacterium]MCB9606369.1 hypothetical protein [Polyangiaceae bacterium]